LSNGFTPTPISDKFYRGFYRGKHSGKVKNRYQSQLVRGFTLIEMLVAIFLFSIITIGLIAIFSNIFSSANKQNSLVASQDLARKLCSNITNQLRNAQTGSDGSYAIDTAGDQELAFHVNLDSGASLERVRYYLQNGKLYQGVENYLNNTYSTSTEKSVMVLDNVANSPSTPLFIITAATTSALPPRALWYSR